MPPPNSSLHPVSREWGRRHTIAVTLLVAAAIATLAGRDVIRAHWWAWQLPHASKAGDRRLYERKLASVGGSALAATTGLGHHPDPGVRLAAVRTWRDMNDGRAVLMLAAMIADPSEEVRLTAIRALAVYARPQPSGLLLDALRDVIAGPRQRDALVAVTVLARLPGDAAEAAFRKTLVAHPDPAVRVQAIECIDEQRRREFIPDLLAALLDAGSYEGLTERQRLAAGALEQLGPQLRAASDRPDPGALQLDQRHSVSGAAAAALAAITGLHVDFDPADAAARQQAREAWQRLIAEGEMPSVDSDSGG